MRRISMPKMAILISFLAPSSCKQIVTWTYALRQESSPHPGAPGWGCTPNTARTEFYLREHKIYKYLTTIPLVLYFYKKKISYFSIVQTQSNIPNLISLFKFSQHEAISLAESVIFDPSRLQYCRNYVVDCRLWSVRLYWSLGPSAVKKSQCTLHTLLYCG